MAGGLVDVADDAICRERRTGNLEIVSVHVLHMLPVCGGKNLVLGIA